ncbi:hypothetical protein NECID01_1234 [Nematocida sp. AWRm77]|nr:hypothetical protein NECID01_1234 [Nematocida sp. AWRm77]
MGKKQYMKRIMLTENELKTPKEMTPKEQMKAIRTRLPQDIIQNVVQTDKALREMERTNALTFICDLKATKPEIKNAVEALYGVRPQKVNTAITFKGYKKAYAMFKREVISAEDLAAKMELFQ